MLQDLDATLQRVLDDAAAPPDLRAADVAFVTPDRDYRPTQPTINLYLHDLGENRTLRDDRPVLERTGDTYASRLPPVRVDCTYLVTAWSADTAGAKVAQEHRLLGLALSWFSRFPVLDDRFLAGALKNPPQPYPVPMSVAQSREGQSMGHFWTALGIPPRPAFSVTVTVTVDPFDHVEEFPALKKLQILSGSLVDPRLGGRVLDRALTGVPGADVTAVGAGVTTMTDARGGFTLPGLAFGTWTLRVQAAGHPQTDVSVTYETDHQFHDVILPVP
jgi:hypothetical protein